MTDYFFEIALSKLSSVGPVTARLLVSYCGCAEGVFKEKRTRLEKIPGIGQYTLSQISLETVTEETEKELAFIHANDISILYYLENKYPSRLKNFQDSPCILYYKGKADLNHPRIVAVVGTRNITDYGRAVTERFVEGIREADILVVSGLAYGVDTLAHRKSIECQIQTVGVLGHGLDNIYPQQNKKLADQMTENGGLLTQFGINTRPDKENFPLRNKVVAAMADAIVVIESKLQGGSIITAEYGNQYHKDVFAYPGRIIDDHSAGCNELIRANKASLLTGPDDFLQNMQWISDKRELKKNFVKELVFDLSPEESSIISVLDKEIKIHIDQIHYKVNLTPGVLAGLLLTLEFRGVIRELPGKHYVLNNLV
ncbi:MAG: DNA-processing protein DprA [Saprospiraceae bacterium]